MFQKLITQALNWNASFIHCDTLLAVSDAINRPHEDYPALVDATSECILYLEGWLEEGRPITSNLLLELHHYLFAGTQREHLGGRWRNHSVLVDGEFIPAPYLAIPDLMVHWCDWQKTEDMYFAYKVFQCIHPFSDGNGRMGGIILAAKHNVQQKSYVGPLQ